MSTRILQQHVIDPTRDLSPAVAHMLDRDRIAASRIREIERTSNPQAHNDERKRLILERIQIREYFDANGANVTVREELAALHHPEVPSGILSHWRGDHSYGWTRYDTLDGLSVAVETTRDDAHHSIPRKKQHVAEVTRQGGPDRVPHRERYVNAEDGPAEILKRAKAVIGFEATIERGETFDALDAKWRAARKTVKALDDCATASEAARRKPLTQKIYTSLVELEKTIADEKERVSHLSGALAEARGQTRMKEARGRIRAADEAITKETAQLMQMVTSASSPIARIRAALAQRAIDIPLAGKAGSPYRDSHDFSVQERMISALETLL
jgi:hypothetical protein